MASINFAALMGTIKGDVRHNTTQNSQVANFTLVTKARHIPMPRSIFSKRFTTSQPGAAWQKM